MFAKNIELIQVGHAKIHASWILNSSGAGKRECEAAGESQATVLI
jgi:hypothetical protein